MDTDRSVPFGEGLVFGERVDGALVRYRNEGTFGYEVDHAEDALDEIVF